jgi:hypothetical protein
MLVLPLLLGNVTNVELVGVKQGVGLDVVAVNLTDLYEWTGRVEVGGVASGKVSRRRRRRSWGTARGG